MRKKAYFIAGFLMLSFQLAPLAVGAQNTGVTGVAVETKDQNIQTTNPIPPNHYLDLDTMRQKMNLDNKVEQQIKQGREDINKKAQIMRDELKAKREVMMEQVKMMRQKFQDDTKARREALRNQFGDQRTERIEAFFNKMIGKFQAAIDRLKNLADRISARIDKAAANGKDVTRLRDQLSQAKDKISDAEKALEDAKAKYTEATQEKDFKIAFNKVREVVQGVTEKVKDAHRALVEVVNSIKGLGNGSGHATTTKE